MLEQILRERIAAATRETLGAEAAEADPAVHRSAHADFQADIALALARKLKKPPREVATQICERLLSDRRDVAGDVIAEATVSGPGFINLTLRADYLAAELGRLLRDERLGVPVAAEPQKVVIDYSAPNVAKEMHVGHLRSTIIGDCIARVLEFQHHQVIRQNHIGDWGTPFGMLIEHLLDEGASPADADARQLADAYRAARAKFDADPAFADRARQRVVLLQKHDPETLQAWRHLIDRSVDYFTDIYQQMDVTLRREHVAGESKYNDELPGLVTELLESGVARMSDGAVCVFPPGFTGRENEPVPLIVRKQDGGYGYAATDLAAMRYRIKTVGARRIIYVVGAPQTQHFAMVFAAAKMAGWNDGSVRLEHVAFGSVLGPDKKMLRTRAGDPITLLALVREAVERATEVVEQRSDSLDADTRRAVARGVGIGAVKYADLSNDRLKDYVFDWNRMLAFDGNTAPYIMYAHARCHSILRKAGVDPASLLDAPAVGEPGERALALELLDFAPTVARTAESLQPHRICAHLHAAATAYSTFFETLPVLKSPEPARSARLALCLLTARVLGKGLDLLGISAPEQM